MQDLIYLSQYTFLPQLPPQLYPAATIDIKQILGLCHITSIYFPWVITILAVNRKNWKRPVFLLLIVHWFLRATGDLINKTMYFDAPAFQSITPENAKTWYIGISVAHIFWFSGEIIGDWYPLLRTKAIINNKKKVRIVYLTCAFYNIAKLYAMNFYFIEIPRQLAEPNMDKHNLRWWIVILVVQITSFFYDLSILLVLRHNLFNQIKDFRLGGNSFIEKFKKVSEFRIMISMGVTLLFMPIIIVSVIYYVNTFEENSPSKIEIDCVENMRRGLVNVNFILMYIDQILLICYVGRKKTTNVSSSQSQTYTYSQSQAVTFNKSQNQTLSFNQPNTYTLNNQTYHSNDTYRKQHNTSKFKKEPNDSYQPNAELLLKRKQDNNMEEGSGSNSPYEETVIPISSLPASYNPEANIKDSKMNNSNHYYSNVVNYNQSNSKINNGSEYNYYNSNNNYFNSNNNNYNNNHNNNKHNQNNEYNPLFLSMNRKVSNSKVSNIKPIVYNNY